MIGEFAFIGYGEAGRAFANLLGQRAFDIDPARSGTASLGEALEAATCVVSVVTADQAIPAARAAAEHLQPDTLYCDMNSVSPQTKATAAAIIEAVNGRYVDVAIMAPVHPDRLATPLLLSGPHAAAGNAALVDYGFTNIRVVGPRIGQASTIKLLRSIMVKGLEALTAEMMFAAEASNTTSEVLASLGGDWEQKALYNLERMATHGLRRAAEMEEAAQMLVTLGVEPLMTQAMVIRQRQAGQKS